MNLTNVKYLYDLMDKDSFTFFTVYDSKGSPMRDQCNESYSVDDAKEDLQQFLQYNTGVFRVEFRRTRANTQQTKNYSFTVDNFKNEEEDKPMGSTMMGGNTDYVNIITSKDERIGQLQEQMYSEMVANLNKQHEMQLNAIRAEGANKNGNNDALIQAALSAITGMFGSQQIGVSGIETMEMPQMEQETIENNNNMDDKTKKINNAVVRLIRGDKNFAEHITKLANLCDDNILIYNMAIAKLNNL
tara:strand:- start:48 stop:782 length:735 start_codon:yes stop_codon:yes gene_type:complete